MIKQRSVYPPTQALGYYQDQFGSDIPFYKIYVGDVEITGIYAGDYKLNNSNIFEPPPDAGNDPIE